MRLFSIFNLWCVLFLILLSLENSTVLPLTIDKSSKQKTITAQIPFIANYGNTDKNVEFYVQIRFGTVFVTKKGEIAYLLPESCQSESARGIHLREKFVDAHIGRIDGLELNTVKLNSFIGNDQSKWRTNIPTYNFVDFGEVYDGVRVKLKATMNNVEKLFFVSPNGDPKDIRLLLEGAEKITINCSEELEAATELGLITFTKPVAYQEIEGKRKYVDAKYILNDNEYGFEVGEYDKTKTLIIDPLLASTHIGGNQVDDNYEPSILIDDEGYVYISGYTSSTDFPTTPGVISENFTGNTDRFISKFDNDLTTLIASTLIGGTNNETGFGMDIGADGNIYIAGYTRSVNYPVTANSYDETPNGNIDVYLSKLNNSLTQLLASTYIGGYENEGEQWPRIMLKVHSDGNIYVTGHTKSLNFPTTVGAYDNSFNGSFDWGGDVFVIKLDNNLSNLLASTYIGGSNIDARPSLTIDGQGNVFVAGFSESNNFPTTPGSYNENRSGGEDIFVSKFSNDLTNLSASVMIGGIYDDEALSIQAGPTGDIYIVGYTRSSSFPSTQNAYDNSYNGGERDAIVLKLNNDLSTLVASTFIGGNELDYGKGIFIDQDENVYITGYSRGGFNPFPTLDGSYDREFSGGNITGDCIIAKFDRDLTTLLASTYFGGTGDEAAYTIALDSQNNIFIAGIVMSYSLPVTANAYDRSFNGAQDCFIAKFDNSLSEEVTSINSHLSIPDEYTLFNNYPNPFNPSTLINYQIPEPGVVILKVYDILGVEVAELVNEYKPSGFYSVEFSADRQSSTRNLSPLSSGVYFYTINVNGWNKSGKMLLAK